jgi:hypothetical protein
LNTEKYLEIRENYVNIDYLLTASEIEKTDKPNELKIKKYDERSLYDLR